MNLVTYPWEDKEWFKQTFPQLSSFSLEDPRLKNIVVAVGVSGGVDSAVSLLILKKIGFQVKAFFMKNWDDSEDEFCPAAKDYKDVQSLCEQLDVAYFTLEFIEEYKAFVFETMAKQYKEGLTPNPDVLCNQFIKFDFFLKAIKSFGADFLATGHYAQLTPYPYLLRTPLSQEKDQTYFLCRVKAEVWPKIFFPLARLEKTKVRFLAQEFNLPVANKKDSTGLCFIGERPFASFLGKYVSPQKGLFKTPEGKIVGEHEGHQFFTIGQRKGLGIGGPGSPWYVVGKNPKENEVVVVRGGDHPLLYCTVVSVKDFFWQSDSFISEFLIQGRPLMAKIRYRSSFSFCTILEFTEDYQILKINFKTPQRAVTSGQYLVLYDVNKEKCLGCGVIFT